MKPIFILALTFSTFFSFCCDYKFYFTEKTQLLERYEFVLRNLENVNDYYISIYQKDTITQKVYYKLISLEDIHFYCFKNYENFQSNKSIAKIISQIKIDTIYLSNKVKIGYEISQKDFKKLNKLNTQEIFKLYFTKRYFKKNLSKNYRNTIAFILNRRFIEISIEDLSGNLAPRVKLENCK